MPRMLEEVTLSFVHERIRFDNGDGPGTAILVCRPDEPDTGPLGIALGLADTIVKVDCGPSDFVRGLDYRFYGHWTEHPKYGRQFLAKTFVGTQPHGRVGVIRYLMQAPWIGRAAARTLWEKFAGDAVRVARTQPDVASAAIGNGFTLARATEAAAALESWAKLEATTIDLMELFAGRGFPKSLGTEVVKEWGNRAAELIRRNPFLLMSFPRCGFLLCDQLYLDLGGDPARRKRQALCAIDAIQRNSDGHTWHRPKVIERALQEKVVGAKVRAVDAVRLAIRAKQLTMHRDGSIWLADAMKAENETAIAERVCQWIQEPSNWPNVNQLDVSEHQRERLAEALMCPLAILTGGPGTGKTYVAARVIAEIVRRHGDGCVAIAAPTGKAAVRITEAMAGYGIGVRARTVHSLLGVTAQSRTDGWSFEHGEGNLLPFRFIIIDETSMMDCDLMAAFVRACAKNTHVLLVGDTGQLPPVGHGAPLRDLMAAEVPCGELTEIRRNSGDIVQACHLIRDGQRFKPSPILDPDAGQNLRLLPAVSANAAMERIIKTIRSIGNRGLANPIWDCQVIVAVNKKSELSRQAVNQRLQRELNPGGEQAGGNPFRTSDKIVCLKNSFMPVVDDAPAGFNAEVLNGRTFIANGEQAAVKHIQPQLTIAQLDSPARLIKIPRGKTSEADGEDAGTGCQWDLAYGISCHKSQGSEWPIVLVVLDEHPGARMVCSREWLYTAVSRAKLACFLVGKLATGHGMIGRQAIKNRKTFLKELIESER